MSRKKGAARKRRKRLKSVVCVSCLTNIDSSPLRLLNSLAEILNMAEQAEDKRMRIRFRHGAAFSEVGVVVPPFKKQPWECKPFVLDGLSSPDADGASDGLND